MSIERTKEFVKDIINGSLTGAELNAIAIALRERKNILKFENQATMRIGSKVVLHGLRGKWNGAEAEITGFSPRRTHVNITITKSPHWEIPVGPVRGSRFPIKCVAPLDAPPVADIEAPSEGSDASALQAFLAS